MSSAAKVKSRIGWRNPFLSSEFFPTKTEREGRRAFRECLPEYEIRQIGEYRAPGISRERLYVRNRRKDAADIMNAPGTRTLVCFKI